MPPTRRPSRPSRSSAPARWAARSSTDWCAPASPAAESPRRTAPRPRPPSSPRSTASRASRSRSSRRATRRPRHPPDIVLVGVKPAMVPDLLREIAPHLRPGAIVVSLAAGVTIATFESILGDDVAVLRSMPNTPALVGKAVTGLAAGQPAPARPTSRVVRRLFETVGSVVEVPESQIDALSTISGSGPAYVFLLIEELTEAAVGQGLHRGRGAAHGRADLHRRGGAARGIRRGPRRAAPSRDEPQGHHRARDRGAAGGAHSTACSPRRRMPRSAASRRPAEAPARRASRSGDRVSTARR